MLGQQNWGVGMGGVRGGESGYNPSYGAMVGFSCTRCPQSLGAAQIERHAAGHLSAFRCSLRTCRAVFNSEAEARAHSNDTAIHPHPASARVQTLPGDPREVQRLCDEINATASYYQPTPSVHFVKTELQPPPKPAVTTSPSSSSLELSLIAEEEEGEEDEAEAVEDDHPSPPPKKRRGVKPGKPSKGGKAGKRVECRDCGADVKNATENMKIHVVREHIRKPRLTCGLCEFSAWWNFSPIRQHIVVHHEDADPESDFTDHETELRPMVDEWMLKAFNRRISRPGASTPRSASLLDAPPPPAERLRTHCSICQWRNRSKIEDRLYHIITAHADRLAQAVRCRVCQFATSSLPLLKQHFHSDHPTLTGVHFLCSFLTTASVILFVCRT